MKIKPKFNVDKLFAGIAEKVNGEVMDQVVETLDYIGLLAVKHAKSVPADIGFTDQTGNLRSSIGYCVYRGGRLVKQNFDGTQEGAGIGRSVAERAAAELPPNVTALVVVAGMDYALYVESKGRDVLTSAELLAKQLAEQFFTR